MTLITTVEGQIKIVELCFNLNVFCASLYVPLTCVNSESSEERQAWLEQDQVCYSVQWEIDPHVLLFD